MVFIKDYVSGLNATGHKVTDIAKILGVSDSMVIAYK